MINNTTASGCFQFSYDPPINETSITYFSSNKYPLSFCINKLVISGSSYVKLIGLENVTNCEFIFNAQVIHEFSNYNGIMENNSKSYKSKVVKSALRKLVDHNVIMNIKRGKYMINPMLMGGTSSADRRRLIIVYSNILLAKGKNISTRFYS